jgi:hypothetical protein
VDVPDVPGFSRVALGEGTLRSQNRGECSAKVSTEKGRLSLDKGHEIVKEVSRHAVDRDFLKPSRHVKVDENSILKRLRVRVRVD